MIVNLRNLAQSPSQRVKWFWPRQLSSILGCVCAFLSSEELTLIAHWETFYIDALVRSSGHRFDPNVITAFSIPREPMKDTDMRNKTQKGELTLRLDDHYVEKQYVCI